MADKDSPPVSPKPAALPSSEGLGVGARVDAKTLDALCREVDAITDPAKRKAFFLAHPELEVRYSHANFIK